MKELKFKTSKGEFIIYDKVDITQTQLIFFNQYGIKLSEINEEQASNIVDEIHGNVSFITTLNILLKSKAIHLYKNPYPNAGLLPSSEQQLYREAEQRTFYNPYIFKL